VNLAPAKVAVGALLGAVAGPVVYARLGPMATRAALLALLLGSGGLVWAWLGRSAAGVATALMVVVVGLSLRALAPLDTLDPGPVSGVVVLRGDPEVSFGGIEVVVADGDRRLLASIDGPSAGEVAALQLGDSMRVTGRTRRFRESTGWHRSRHLAGELQVDWVGDIRVGRGAVAVAAGVRERIRTSVAPLDPDARALVLGAALGDDRTQSAAQRDRFLRSGLTHLLVVSGQNVALMLVLCAPLITRVPVGRRWMMVTAVVGWFVVLVRPDPSVLRAGAAALVAAVAARRGHLVDASTVLAGALTAVVLVDPLVVGSLGFWLSAAATLGLVVGLGDRRGSDVNPVAVARATLAAQVGVAPVLAAAGLAVPLASFPANILAGAPAGFLTLWGMTVGLVAGTLPGPVATAARLPVAMAAWWVDGVARSAALLPLGRVTPTETYALMALGLATWMVWGHWEGRSRAVVASKVLWAPLVVAALWAGRPIAPTSGAVPGGCLLVDERGTVLVLERAPPSDRRLLAALADVEVRRIDVLAVTPGGLRLAATVVQVRDALPVGVVTDRAVTPGCEVLS
jgi:competence protein ComEC